MNGKVMPVRIVPMKTEHLDAVAELERSCFTVPWSRNALAEELDNALSAFLVALDENDRVVGYAGLQVVLDEGYITNVAVRPDCRRRGVAGKLLDVFERFAEGGLETIDIFNDNGTISEAAITSRFSRSRCARATTPPSRSTGSTATAAWAAAGITMSIPRRMPSS